AGTRRIEAVCGSAAEAYLAELAERGAEEEQAALAKLAAANEALEALGAAPISPPAGADPGQVTATAVEAEKALKTARAASAARQADGFLADLVEGGAVGSNLVESLEGSPAILQELLNGLKKLQFSQAAFLVVDDGEKLHLGALCGADGNKAGHDAGTLIKDLAPIVGGKGGGRPDMARGAGADRQQKDTLLEAARAKLL
ncbi:MAG: DHHA1 domain-containing protein, partial [Verrucomicrobiota bacterium]|nr:DHHA1 domain-containing protein [Verrucomicrobiota bacterium]